MRSTRSGWILRISCSKRARSESVRHISVSLNGELIEDRDETVVTAYIDNIGIDYVDWDTIGDDIDDRYAGEFEDLADYAYRLAEDSGDLPTGTYANYVDWEAVGRDYRLSGDVWIHEAGYKSTHVFRSN